MQIGRIESGPVMAKVSSKYLFKFPGTLLYKTRNRSTAPIFKIRGIRWGKNREKEGLRVRSETLHKKGVFPKIANKMG